MTSTRSMRLLAGVLLTMMLPACVAYVPAGRPVPRYGYYLGPPVPPPPPPRPYYYGRPYYAAPYRGW